MCCWKQNICPNQLDVQETNCCLAQFHRIRNRSCLDAGLRLDGTPALGSWDLIVAVLGNTNQSHKEKEDLLMKKREVRSTTSHTSKNECNLREQSMIWTMSILFPLNVNSSRQEALLHVFQENEAVIKMIIKGRSPTMRHASRNHRVALDWSFDRIDLDPKIQIQIH